MFCACYVSWASLFVLRDLGGLSICFAQSVCVTVYIVTLVVDCHMYK